MMIALSNISVLLMIFFQILISFPFFSVQDLFIYKKDILQILQIMEVVQHQSETGQKINNHNKDGLSQVAMFPDNPRVCHPRGHPKSLIWGVPAIQPHPQSRHQGVSPHPIILADLPREQVAMPRLPVEVPPQRLQFETTDPNTPLPLDLLKNLDCKKPPYPLPHPWRLILIMTHPLKSQAFKVCHFPLPQHQFQKLKLKPSFPLKTNRH